MEKCDTKIQNISCFTLDSCSALRSQQKSFAIELQMTFDGCNGVYSKHMIHYK